MGGTLVGYQKGAAKVSTPVDDQGDGLPVNVTGGALSADAKATAADPVYVEGSTDPLSMDLAGYLRTLAKMLALATAAAPAYAEGTFNPTSINLTGDLRVIAKQSGAWTITTTPTKSTTGTQTSVASNAASVALLAANAARLGATITNDGANNLFVRLNSGAASATTYTIELAPAGYYEVPFNYTGAITGIWDVATGSARITELT